ncbi:MAG TPA: type II toxin-antitoxin system VapB family antitoxin [Polyangiaceae bacterium]|nr:type II toxin-antitoxin system VapB family antitoxin [Polyangiaceae bacterium]
MADSRWRSVGRNRGQARLIARNAPAARFRLARWRRKRGGWRRGFQAPGAYDLPGRRGCFAGPDGWVAHCVLHDQRARFHAARQTRNAKEASPHTSGCVEFYTWQPTSRSTTRCWRRHSGSGGHKTKRATVTEALNEYIQRRKQARIVELFGKVDVDPQYDYKAQRRRR